MTLRKVSKRGLMSTVLGRMAGQGESLISDRHADSMLFGLLSEADQVTDPVAAWDEARTELCGSWGVTEDVESGPSKPFIYRDGIAVIPVHGILINRFNWCWGFVTGYDFIRKQKNMALADPDVKLIVYDHDTPGGEAAGCAELAQEIFDERDVKPSLALVNSTSCSGGYWLAAPCGRVVAAPSASVGSIGVYIQHMNIAKMMAEWGIEVEFVKNGDYKTSGNMYEKLSDKDREYLQSMVDERAVEFHRAVAEFRGIEESVVKDTQARVMRPTEAIALGLIDAAENPTTAVATFVAELGNDEPIVEDSQEDVMAEMTSEDRAAVTAETKARIKGIMTSEEAKGREGLAEHLAYNTDQTVEEATASLKASPKVEAVEEEEVEEPTETPEEKKAREEKEAADQKEADDKAKGGSHFENAMDNGQHPNVGEDGKGGGDQTESQQAVARILGAQSAATGRKFEKA